MSTNPSFSLGYAIFSIRTALKWPRVVSRIKVKLSHYTPWRHRGDRRYSSYSFTTSAL
jgi:hypothetical protein